MYDYQIFKKVIKLNIITIFYRINSINCTSIKIFIHNHLAKTTIVDLETLELLKKIVYYTPREQK